MTMSMKCSRPVATPPAFNWNESLAADELRTQLWTMIQVCFVPNEANMHAHCSPDVAAVS